MYGLISVAIFSILYCWKAASQFTGAGNRDTHKKRHKEKKGGNMENYEMM